MKNIDYLETTFKGRKVLKLKKGITPGKPKVLHPKLNATTRKQIVENGYTNLDFMKLGRPPIGLDGLPVNMHHVEGMEPGIMAELPQTIHQGESRILHGFIDRSWRKLYPERVREYERWREDYWKAQAELYE